MELLLIPGEGKDSNKKWLNEIESRLYSPLNSPFRRSTRVQYRHWHREGAEFEPLQELSQLRDYLHENALAPYIVFAKSAGSVLFLQALADGVLQPAGAVFAGLPLPQKPADGDAYKMFDISGLLRGYTIPTVIIQNETERFRRPGDVCASLAAWGVASCEVVAGTDTGHTYSVDTVVRHVLAQAAQATPR